MGTGKDDKNTGSALMSGSGSRVSSFVCLCVYISPSDGRNVIAMSVSVSRARSVGDRRRQGAVNGVSSSGQDALRHRVLNAESGYRG